MDVSEFRNAIKSGRTVLVAGTGVSLASSSNRDCPNKIASWTGLLEDGLNWLIEHKHSVEKAKSNLSLLKNDPGTHNFVAIAEDIVSGMGGVYSQHYKKWLSATVGKLGVVDNRMTYALHKLRERGCLLATTNYDDVLLLGHQELTPLTWLESGEIIKAIRLWDTTKVIYLHGYWQTPNSVVLDWKSYERISRDEDYREDLAAFWKTTTWVYVGCGVNGLSDPDFGLLLERYAGRAREYGHWDYCLVRTGQLREFQAHFESNSLNIRAVPFGDEYDDIFEFLKSLLPENSQKQLENNPATEGRNQASDTPGKTQQGESAALGNLYHVPNPPAFFVGREKEILTATELLLNENRRTVVISGDMLIGKSSLASVVANQESIRKHFVDGIVWLGPFKQKPEELHVCHSILLNSILGLKQQFASNNQARSYSQKHLASKQILLVLDGLESLEQFDVFDVLSTGSRVLITTRDSKCVRDPEAELCQLGALSEASAKQLLAELSETDLTEDAHEIAKTFGSPLMLRLNAEMVASGNSWEFQREMLRILQNRRKKPTGGPSNEPTVSLSNDFRLNETASDSEAYAYLASVGNSLVSRQWNQVWSWRHKRLYWQRKICYKRDFKFSNDVNLVAVCKIQNLLLLATRMGIVELWTLDPIERLCKFSLSLPPRTSVSSIAFGTGNEFITGLNNGGVSEWELNSGKPLRSLGEHDPGAWVTCVQVTPVGNELVALANDRRLVVWSRDRDKTISNRRLLSASDVARMFETVEANDRLNARLFNGQNYMYPPNLFGPTGQVVGLMSQGMAGKKLLVSTGNSKTTVVVDTRDWTPVHELDAPKGDVMTLLISEAEDRAVTTHSDKTIRVWDVETGLCMKVFRSEVLHSASCWVKDHDSLMLGDTQGGIWRIPMAKLSP